jgi:hypothetical protein
LIPQGKHIKTFFRNGKGAKMKTNKALLAAIALVVIGALAAADAYAGGQLEEIGGKVRKANETVKNVNEIIRDVDETVEGVGGAKEGVKDIAKDTAEVVGIDTSAPAPAQNAEPAEPPPVTAAQAGGGSAGIVGTWEYKSRFSPSRFEFTADAYAYYRGGALHTSGRYAAAGNTVKLLNESGNDFETITIDSNSFEFWGSIFTKQPAEPPPVTATQAGGTGAALVLAKGEAWVNGTGSIRDGYIFHSEGKYTVINDYDGQKVGEWVAKHQGSWTVNGNKLKVESDNGVGRTYTFTVSGNTLTLDFLGDKAAYTRTKGINPTGRVWGQ